MPASFACSIFHRTNQTSWKMEHTKEAGTELRVGVVVPSPEAGSRLRLQLANATHLRTQMRCLQVDRDSMGVKDLLQRSDDLPADSLLEGETAGEETEDAGKISK